MTREPELLSPKTLKPLTLQSLSPERCTLNSYTLNPKHQPAPNEELSSRRFDSQVGVEHCLASISLWLFPKGVLGAVMGDTFPIPIFKPYIPLRMCLAPFGLSLGAGTPATSSSSFTDWNVRTCLKTKAYNSKQACNDILPDIDRRTHTHTNKPVVLSTLLTTTRHTVIESPRHALFTKPAPGVRSHGVASCCWTASRFLTWSRG